MKTTSCLTFILLAFVLTSAPAALAHCDSVNGPVVQAAHAALESGDVTPLLQWVHAEQEAELHAAFEQALAARRQGGAASELAGRYFSETAVRLHRAAEGAPYTGIKDVAVPQEIAAVDAALEKGSVGPVAGDLAGAVAAGLRQRFAIAAEKRAHGGENVVAGRAYVAAYVELVHYVEAVSALAAGEPVEQHAAAAHN